MTLSKAAPILFVLALVCSTSSYSQPVTIRTLAGNGSQGAADGYGSNARFSHACGITADSAGNVYVADTGNHTIRKITPDGNVGLFAGMPGVSGTNNGVGTNAQFNGPQGIAADASGQIYVADSANNTVRKITPAGVVTTFAGIAGSANSFDGTGANAAFNHPEGVATDATGNVYVADTWNHTIRMITPGAVVTTLAGWAGNFGAADGTNSRARFNRPTGVAVDSATNVWVADSLNHTIRRITSAGTVSTIAGQPGIWGNADGTNSSARFYQPQGIGITAKGDVFVTDSGNQTLRKISAADTNWIVSTVAGLGGLAGNINGTGTGAQFYFPAGTVVDNAGCVYVADLGNNAIRTTRIVPPTLLATRSGDQLVVSWPASAEGFRLEQSAAVGPSASWSSATNGVVVAGDNFVRTNALLGAAVYYRLKLP